MNYNTNPKDAVTVASVLWPLLTNPITIIAMAGIGGGVLISKLLFGDDKPSASGSEPLKTVPEPLDEPYVEPLQTVEETVQPTVNEPFEDEPEEVEIEPSEEDIKREMLRQTMSELGKRSGAARRAKQKQQEGA